MQTWIFWVGDVILVVAAWFIHDGADHPNGGVALIATVSCVVAAVFVAVIPSIVEYSRRQDEALDNRQRALQALAVTVAAASEQVSIAATGLQGIAEAAQDNFSRTEQLSKQINEQIAELEGRLANSKKDDGESAAKLEAVAKKIGKAAAEFDAAVSRAASAAATHIPEVPPVIASRIVEIRPAVSASVHPFEAPAAPPPAAPARVEAAIADLVSSPEPDTTPALEAPTEPSVTPPPAAPAPRKRSPRKVAPAPIVEAPAPDLVLESPPPDEAPPTPAPQEIAEPAVSSDGATRLVVTAYIGIGNRIFIRGEGPGLSWEKGVPLTFVSIGKWRWETKDATSTVRFKLYKNDQTECTALGESSVEPGAQQELSAAF
jgi:hypothetical protein